MFYFLDHVHISLVLSFILCCMNDYTEQVIASVTNHLLFWFLINWLVGWMVHGWLIRWLIFILFFLFRQEMIQRAEDRKADQTAHAQLVQSNYNVSLARHEYAAQHPAYADGRVWWGAGKDKKPRIILSRKICIKLFFRIKSMKYRLRTRF